MAHPGLRVQLLWWQLRWEHSLPAPAFWFANPVVVLTKRFATSEVGPLELRIRGIVIALLS